jgi:methylmalonyl-CoA mutase C-terminal domain/subunit
MAFYERWRGLMTRGRRIRVLVAKPGLDGHDRGAHVVALGLRDHGMEVVYTGLRQSPEEIARAAVQESVDVVGLSSLSGGHKYLFPEVSVQLDRLGMSDVLLIGGGMIPDDDIPFLRENGIDEIFRAGTSIKEIAEFIEENARRKKKVR